MAPVWITRLNASQRSPVASSRSAARIRWPVLEIGRNSVSPSTMPRTTALSRRARSIFSSLLEKARDGLPEGGDAVRTIVVRALQLDPLLRAAPGVVERPRALDRDHFVARGGNAEQRHRELPRPLSRIERVAQHEPHRQIRIVMLRHL